MYKESSEPISNYEIAEFEELSRKSAQGTRRNTFGGREDIKSVYDRAKSLIIKHQLLVLKQFEVVSDIKRLTICNSWRIERHPDQSTHVFEFDFNSGDWIKTTNFDNWPYIPIWPPHKTSDPNYWPSLVSKAISRVLAASGFDDLPEYLNPFPIDVVLRLEDIKARWGNDSEITEVIGGYKKEMTPKRMADLLIASYTTPTKNKWWLRKESMEKGARALRAALWQHMLDREVVSALLAINRYELHLTKCLDWSANRREHLLRINSEARNLLPILAEIEYQYWHRSDLFGRKLWVRGSRKTTIVDRQFRGFKSFDNKAAWRWLSKASIVVVSLWVSEGCNKETATNLALAASGITAKVPVIALLRVISQARDRLQRNGLGRRYGVSPVLQHVYRLYLVHAAQLWMTSGFKAVKNFVGSRTSLRLADVIDFLEGEGFEQGFPDKNSTWSSLEKRSIDWHQRVAIQAMEHQLGVAPNNKWDAEVAEVVIDDILFRPLQTSYDLTLEGYELGHCVSQYARRCFRGSYRVYSVTEPNQTRSTIGLFISHGTASLDQHRGKYNGKVSSEARRAGHKLVILYSEALAMKKKAT